jgi:triacylglycerol lipase
MAMIEGLSPNSRIHVILIPGFAGFDALGQLEYYAGVTRLFHNWYSKHKDRATAVLHYFDNFPTAAVATRSELLRQYIAKRIARGEFTSDDKIALVGHSTGGLDIRLLLWDLAHSSSRILTDGGRGKAVEVDREEILRQVDRVVFLSVPQWGTNIADWVHTYRIERHVVLADLRAAVTASQIPLVDTIEHLIGGAAADLADTDLMFAIRDALREAEADTRRDAMGTAKAQEAASLLALWLRHMCTDFGALDDLTARSSCENDRSPAHFTSDERDEEQEIWAEHNIKTLSFATIGNNPFNLPEGPVPRWELLKPWTYPECNNDSERAAKTDVPYRVCYRACAGGPFTCPPHSGRLVAKGAQSGKLREIEVWENDGIVNTASMLWPNWRDTVLVEGDHMDIVGHYERVCAIDGRGREFQAYDLLKSGSGFTTATFNDVWTQIFDFCIPAKTSASGASRTYVGALPRSRSKKP